MMNWKEKVLGGLPLSDIEILDAHDHIGRWNAFYIPKDGTIEQMVACMDATGIDRVFVTAHAGIGPDYVYGNDIVADAIEKYPDRVWGYVTVNPNYGEDQIPEILRRFAKPGFRGIKLHPGCHGRPIDYFAYAPVYEYADEHKLPMLIHVWGKGDVAAIDRLSVTYPNVRFIMGHSGADWAGITYAMDLMNKRPNVYGDTALSVAQEGNIEWMVHEADPKKILFGSDMPFYDPTPTIGRIALADISDEIKKDIFGRNLKRLMGIE